MLSLRYKNVYVPNPRDYNRKKQWKAKIQIDKDLLKKYFKTEKEAAEAVDLFLIKHKKEPVNILKEHL